MQSYSIPIRFLRHYCFCPRIPYLAELVGITPKTTLWVQQGIDYHTRLERLMKRRTLKYFNLESPVLHTHISLQSNRYGIHGIADCILEDYEEVVPVEFKSQMKSLQRGTLMQLIGYGLLAAEKYKKPFKQAFVIVGEKRKIIPVKITTETIAQFNQTLTNLKCTLQCATLPKSSATEHQCAQCEYIKFCNDRF